MTATNKTSILVKTALLAAIATILSYMDLALPIFPTFLKIDLADVPAIIGAIILGPVPAVFVVLIKNMIHGLTASTSAWIGEFANFVIGASLVLPIGYTMKNKKTQKNFFIGAIIGIIAMIIVASILNVYVLLPMYARVMNFPIEQVVAVSNAINPNVTSLSTYILFICVPFNALKGIVEMTVSFLLFKSLLKPIINKL